MNPVPCRDDICLTCSDAVSPGRILEVLDDGMARIQTDDGVTEASIDLVDAGPGDVVLLHAGVAISRLAGWPDPITT